MRQNKILNSILVIIFICSSAWAQNAGNFAEQTLPDNSPSKPDLPKIAVTDAPINPLTINKSALIPHTQKNTIDSLLMSTDKITSLMYSDEEYNDIERAVEAFKNNQQFIVLDESSQQKNDDNNEDENEKSFIYLASIIYFSSNDWAVWINNHKITNKTNSPSKELYLTSVKSDSVKVSWKISVSKWRIIAGQKAENTAPNLNQDNQVELEFELRPNQTFALNSNKVTEGRAIIALLKKRTDLGTSKTTLPSSSTTQNNAKK